MSLISFSFHFKKWRKPKSLASKQDCLKKENTCTCRLFVSAPYVQFKYLLLEVGVSHTCASLKQVSSHNVEISSKSLVTVVKIKQITSQVMQNWNDLPISIFKSVKRQLL